MKSFIKGSKAINEWTGRILCYLLYPGFLLLAYEVGMRYFVKAPTVWSLGISQRIFAVYYLMAGAYALLYHSHIRMDIVFNKFSERTRAILDVIVMYPLLYGVCLVMLWHGGKYAWTSVANLELDSTAFMAPVWIAKIFIPIGGFLLLIQAFANFYPTLILAVTGKKWDET